MTSFSASYTVCGVCGSTVKLFVLRSTNAFGSSDLDLRPPEMQRSTMGFWTQVCPECGYTAARLAKAPGFPREFLSSPRYLDCDGLITDSDLARRFYRQHLGAAEESDLSTAADALLHAAWCCDDAGEADNAALLRRKSLELMERELPRLPEEQKEQRMVHRADLLRRTRQFARLIGEYARFKCSSPIHGSIVAFQLMLSKEGDDGRHTVEQAVRRTGFEE